MWGIGIESHRQCLKLTPFSEKGVSEMQSESRTTAAVASFSTSKRLTKGMLWSGYVLCAAVYIGKVYRHTLSGLLGSRRKRRSLLDLSDVSQGYVFAITHDTVGSRF